MSDPNYNPIRGVNGQTVPCPSKYVYELSDVSASDAGRTEDAIMHKMLIAQKVHLELEWTYIDTAAVSAILQAFNQEYLQIEYLDAKLGGYDTKTFYVGDRSAPSYNTYRGIWESLKFNVIER